MKMTPPPPIDEMEMAIYKTSCHILKDVVPAMPVQAMTSAILAILDPILREIPDDKWKFAGEIAGNPCDTPGCTCEKMRAELFPLLDTMRTRFKNRRAERDASGGSSAYPN